MPSHVRETSDTPAPVECVELTHYYGDIRGIDGLDLVVQRGTIVGFLGPNGAGKTTVIRILIGLLRPTGGEARLFGVPVSDPRARRSVGFMPADPVFQPDLSGTDNLDLLCELGGWDCCDRGWASALLELSDAHLARPVRGYSSGMIQKLGLVQAVQHRPDLVILDEPANRLDPIAHRRFEQLVTAIAAAGRTVFLSSHTLSEVEQVCHEVAMVRDGRLLLTTSVAELTAAALRNVVIHYRDRPGPLPDGLTVVSVDGFTVRAQMPGHRPDVLRALLDDGGIDDVLVEPASLEDVFLHLYGGDA